MNELHELLVRAIDRVENPRLEHAALQIAHRRRNVRRGAVAAVVTSALVVTVVVGAQGIDRKSSLPPTAPSSQTAAPPSQSPSPSQTPTSTPLGDQAKVWPKWDPREVNQLPVASNWVAPALPQSIAPPASSPALSDSPITAAVVAVEHDGVAQVLGTGGDWRTVPIEGRYPGLSLSPNGTRLGVFYSFDSKSSEHDYGVTVYDIAAGTAEYLPVPDGFEPWDGASWSFLDEDTLLLISGPEAYAVDVASGEAAETMAPGGMASTLDPEGNWVASASFDQPNILTDYAGGTPREVSMDRTGRLSRIQVNKETVVGTTYDDQAFNVVVADRQTLTPQFRLPVLDHEGNYSSWGLGTLAITDDDTVLLRVAVIGRRVDGFRVVAWKPGTGELSIVSSSALPVEASVVFAQAILRARGP